MQWCCCCWCICCASLVDIYRIKLVALCRGGIIWTSLSVHRIAGKRRGQLCDAVGIIVEGTRRWICILIFVTKRGIIGGCARGRMMGIGVVCRHGRIVHAFLGIVEEVLAVGVSTCAGRWYTGSHRRIIIIVDRKIRKGWLWKGFGDEFTLLVLQMRIVSHGFFPSKLCRLETAFLLFSLHDVTDTLKMNGLRSVGVPSRK